MVNVALLKGIQISRSRVYFHKHNDMEDLERVLSQIDFDEKKVPIDPLLDMYVASLYFLEGETIDTEIHSF